MTRARLRAISPAATADEVAAILAALAAIEAERASALPAVSPTGTEASSAWVLAARLGASRAGLQRGSWRLSGRIGRRARA